MESIINLCHKLQQCCKVSSSYISVLSGLIVHVVIIPLHFYNIKKHPRGNIITRPPPKQANTC